MTQHQNHQKPSHTKSGNLALRRPDPGQVPTGPAAHTGHLQETQGEERPHNVTGSSHGSHDAAFGN